MTLDFTLPKRRDAFGYGCTSIPFNWVEARTRLNLCCDDDTIAVDLPFPFYFYGQEYETAFVCTNGFIGFQGYDYRCFNDLIPRPEPPNAAIYAFWDDLYNSGSIRTETLGTAPDRIWVLEYKDVTFLYSDSERITFEVKLYERNGDMEFLYKSMPASGSGKSATIGLEDESGSIGFLHSFNQPVIRDGMAIRFEPPPSGRWRAS